MSYIHKVWNWIESDFVLIAGLATSLKWVWEYSQSRKFEKNKFLLERIEKFNNLESTQKVQKILDWNSISIEINDVKVKVNDGILVESLKTHDQKVSFDSTEVYLRQIFDDYFTGITELIILSNTGLRFGFVSSAQPIINGSSISFKSASSELVTKLNSG